MEATTETIKITTADLLPLTATVERQPDGTWIWDGGNELLGWSGGYETASGALEGFVLANGMNGWQYRLAAI